VIVGEVVARAVASPVAGQADVAALLAAARAG
jgi:hypothetical protein